MEIRLTVTAKGRFWNGGACIDVDDPMSEVFEPLKTCDDPIMQLINGEILAESTTARSVLKIRKDAADYLANKISDLLLKEMKKNDTHNGYKIHDIGGF